MEDFLLLLILPTLIGSGQVKIVLQLIHREISYNFFYVNLIGTTPHSRCIIYVSVYVGVEEQFVTMDAYTVLKLAQQK